MKVLWDQAPWTRVELAGCAPAVCPADAGQERGGGGGPGPGGGGAGGGYPALQAPLVILLLLPRYGSRLTGPPDSSPPPFQQLKQLEHPSGGVTRQDSFSTSSTWSHRDRDMMGLRLSSESPELGKS